MILLSTTMGVFVILTIFAFYLARFSITENRSSGYYLLDIKARSLALSGLNHSLELFKVNRDISNTTGRINKGDYTIYKVASVDELGESLNRTHYFTFKSIATIDDVKRKIRCQVSSMPEAFSLVFYGNNAGSVDLNSPLGTITGDIFYNGNIISNGGSDSGVNYTSTGIGGTIISNQPLFPEFDDSLFENFLVTALSNNNSNKALDLDVASISIDDHNDINLETHATRTIELWFKVDNKSSGSKQILYEEGGSTRGLNIYISENGLLYVGGWNRKESESQWMGDWISATIQNNQWHHVALTLSGEVDGSISSDALKMYLDGNFINSSQGSQLWQHGANIKVGENGSTRFSSGYDGSAGEYFYGSIDEFRIWNVERSSTEITNYKNSPLTGSESGLVTYFNFEDETANDQQTASDNDGTLSGNYDWVAGSPINISLSNTTINLSDYASSVLNINGDAVISNATINGPGKIVVYGDLTINSSTIGGGVYLICNEKLTVSSSNIGSSLSDYVIAYSKDVIFTNSSTFYGLTISRGTEFEIENTNYYGAIFNESSTIDLKVNANVVGSIVSKYSIKISDLTVMLKKGNLPLFIDQDIGLKPSMVPGSYLEY